MIAFIRHGQTDANLEQRWAGGEWDVALNDTGRNQARSFVQEQGDFLKTLDRVYVSPMIRAQETASIILSEHKTIEVVTVESLREWCLGEWSKMQHHETPNFFRERSSPPGGEPYAVFEDRALSALRRIAACREEKSMVVSHGGLWYAYAIHKHPDNLWIENCTKQDLCKKTLLSLDIDPVALRPEMP